MIRNEELRKKAAAELGLPDTATWEQIDELRSQQRHQEAAAWARLPKTGTFRERRGLFG